MRISFILVLVLIILILGLVAYFTLFDKTKSKDAVSTERFYTKSNLPNQLANTSTSITEGINPDDFYDCVVDSDCDSNFGPDVCFKCHGKRMLVGISLQESKVILPPSDTNGICRDYYNTASLLPYACIIEWEDEEYVTNDAKNAAKYLDLWKSVMLQIISEKYFDDHIAVHWAKFNDVGPTSRFEIDYFYYYDWAAIRIQNAFRVTDDNGTQLSDDAILDNIQNSINIREGRIKEMKSTKKQSEIDSILSNCSNNMEYNIGGGISEQSSFNEGNDLYLEGGRLFLKASGIINYEKNECIYAHIDLESGSMECIETICYIH